METKVFYSVAFCIEEKDFDTVRTEAFNHLIGLTHASREPDGAIRIYTGTVKHDVWYKFREALDKKGVEIF